MRNFVNSTLVLLLMASATVSIAQDDSSVPASVKEFWSHLIGDWEMKGQAGPMPIMGSAHFRWAVGKHSYIGQQVWTLDDGTKLHLALLGGWDPEEKATVEQGFSSSGDAGRVRYRAPTTDAAVMEGAIEGVNGRDAPWSGKVTLELLGPDEFRLTTVVDGQVAHSLTYTRREAARASTTDAPKTRR